MITVGFLTDVVRVPGRGMERMDTADNRSDVETKPLPREIHNRMLELLPMVPFSKYAVAGGDVENEFSRYCNQQARAAAAMEPSLLVRTFYALLDVVRVRAQRAWSDPETRRLIVSAMWRFCKRRVHHVTTASMVGYTGYTMHQMIEGPPGDAGAVVNVTRA